jgi:20S proteasome subunit beta 2
LKIHRLSDNIYALGAGTSADCDFQTRILESQLELLKLNQDRQVRVATAVRKIQQHLFRFDLSMKSFIEVRNLFFSIRYQGYLGAYLIIVGVDITGSHIATVYPHGSISFLPFIASGSGGYTSLSVIEDRFKPNMTVNFFCFPLNIYFLSFFKEDEAKQLVRDALYASTTTDLYSGSKINMYVLTKEKLDKFLPYEIVGVRGDK